MTEVIAALIAAAAALFGVAWQTRKPSVTIEDLTAEKAYLSQATARERDLLGPAHERRLFIYAKMEDTRTLSALLASAGIGILMATVAMALFYVLSDPSAAFFETARWLAGGLSLSILLISSVALIKAARHLSRSSTRSKADWASWRKSSPFRG